MNVATPDVFTREEETIRSSEATLARAADRLARPRRRLRDHEPPPIGKGQISRREIAATDRENNEAPRSGGDGSAAS